MRAWILTATLVLTSGALAQSAISPVPDATTCARMIAPTQTLPPALQDTLQATLTAYRGNLTHLARLLMTRVQTAQEQRDARVMQRELEGYTTRLLGTVGWPADPVLQSSLAAVLNNPEQQWCAGQAALKTSTAPWTAANLIDRALLSLTGNQRYGTVLFAVGRRVKLAQLEDTDAVDARRAAIGLPPLAQSISEAEDALPPRAAPPGLARPVVLREVCKPYTTTQALNTLLTPGRIDALLEEADVLKDQDQASRTGRPGARPVEDVDAESTAWLRAVLRESGWPSANRSDPDLAHVAWLFAQHADRTPDLQACALDLLSQQRSTPAEAQAFAFLTDRVRVRQGQPQVYGTQVRYDDVQDRAFPMTLEDPARVDQRRAALGLEPLADYLKSFENPR